MEGCAVYGSSSRWIYGGTISPFPVPCIGFLREIKLTRWVSERLFFNGRGSSTFQQLSDGFHLVQFHCQ